MNKTLKSIFLFFAIILIGYGIYTLEFSNNYDNTNSYIVIAVGFVSLVLSLIKEKKETVWKEVTEKVCLFQVLNFKSY